MISSVASDVPDVSQSPVFTLRNECQDCYKCIRLCSVQAIKVENGHADVIPGRCISCGRCVAACPGGAKRVRHDLDRARALIQAGEKVIVSLAPSWRGAFRYNRMKIIAILKALGVSEVSETALGAQEVSIKTAALLNESPPGVYISSACPVIVDYVRLYRPDCARYIMPLASPALTHARLIKEHYGEEAKVVFIGPCIGKKNEADREPDLMAVALTFEELKLWIKDAGLDTDNLNVDEDTNFEPVRAHEGALYPLDGGMNESIRQCGLKDDVQLVNLSSLDLFADALSGLDPSGVVRPIFVEALACVGGCIAGPCIASKRSPLLKTSDVLRHVVKRERIPAAPQVSLPRRYKAAAVQTRDHDFEEVRAALNRIGKFSPEDEKNCSGCGYQSCQDLARALLDGNAEPAMCVSHMRRIATRKAAAMLKSMPSAMVMVDSEMNILEANEAFIRMFAGEAEKEYLARPERLAGEPVTDWLEFPNLLRSALKTGADIQRENYLYKKRLYDVHIFNIEPGEILGAIVTDVTQTRSAREKMAQQAREVISKNIATVQEIACLLGEHMVETETLLSAIADDYADDQDQDEGRD